jgi:predicted ATPase/class 3 adenylate cyclase
MRGEGRKLRPMSSLPTGTVTFFFSDVEGSTRLLAALGDEYGELLARHHRILREAFDRCSAAEVGTEGDSFFAVFPSAADAVSSAVDIQRALAAENWPEGAALRVRIGLHTGEGRVGEAGYVGMDVHRGARIMAAGHGGQILISATTRALVEHAIGDGIALRDLGEHRLRDLSGRERIFQVIADGLPTSFPPLRTLEAIPNNLPVQTSELVGRDAELRAIRDHLHSAGVRLVTLTGPGGIGKTRLALQAAADESHQFVDGLYFVDLSSARDSAAALESMVQAVGVTVPAEGDPHNALVAELQSRHALLLLDNFEQVMAATDAVADLLRRCPHLKLLVTSREALRVRGEQLFPVHPLGLPQGGLGGRSAEELSGFEAVRLFVARARQTRPEFALTDENAPVVAEICRRLDGLPLAIELAAARLRLFSPAELLERLGRGLDLLRGGARDLPTRQRTLRGTIEWSYDLLDDEERHVFQLLSVFASARVEAVERVAAAIPALADADVVDRVASLVDKSLVRSTDDAGAQRLSMLDTIREYAAERLESQPDFALAARRAHAEEFAEFADRVRERLARDRERALGEVAAELGNLQAAWRYFVETRDAAELDRLLTALWALHEARGWYHAAMGLTNDLLGVLSSATPSRERAEQEITLRLSLARGLLAIRGYTGEVEDLYRDALALAGEPGAVPRRFPVLRSLASFHLARGELDKSLAIGREVLDLAEQERDPGLAVEGHLIMGPVLAFFGDAQAGLDHLERAIALFDPERHGRARLRLGPSPGVTAGVISALLHWLFGYPDTAARRADAALSLATRLGHPYTLVYATFHVAQLDLWRRRSESALDRATEILKLAEEHEYHIWKALGHVLRGVAIGRLGRPDEGLADVERGIALYENLRTPPVFWPLVLGFRSEACALAGRANHALAIVEQALVLEGDENLTSIALLVQKGDLMLEVGDRDAGERVLRDAFAQAERLSARMVQLRAATRLAQLPATPGRRDATEMLRETLAGFSEGFDTPELTEARALLAGAAPAGS